VKTRDALVALSFDDGPHSVFTPQVLEILERYEAKATFFLIGERAERSPELVERIRAAGHEIANHYRKNGTTLGHSRARFLEELRRTERAIAFAIEKTISVFGAADGDKAGPTAAANRASCGEVGIEDAALKSRRYKGMDNEKCDSTGESSAAKDRKDSGLGFGGKMVQAIRLRFFRAPGGVAWPWQLRLARERGYTCVLGCAYPHDPMRPPVAYIRWLIEKNLRPGTIVILHDGIRDATRSVEALPQILEEGKRRGLRFVSIGELVDSGGEAAGDEL